MGHNRNLADYAHHFDGTHIDLGSGNIETQGVVTFEDVSNVDAVGIVTARAGVKVPDNQKIFLGTDSDLEIYHDGSNARIRNTTGQLWLQSDNGIRFVDSDVNESTARFTDNGAVELYYDGSLKLSTAAGGVNIAGNINLNSADNYEVRFGANNDLKLYHDGTDSWVDTSTGDLILRSTADDVILRGSDDVIIQTDGSDNAIICNNNGSVDLYYNTAKKFETTSDGVEVTGALDLSAIDASISDTATDIFIYDTTKDSDGKAGERELNTLLGIMRPKILQLEEVEKSFLLLLLLFPQLQKLPYMMVMTQTFQCGWYSMLAVTELIMSITQYSGQSGYPTAALNGVLMLGQRTSGDNWGNPIVNFISEYIVRIDPQGGEGGIFNGKVAQRNYNMGFNSPGKLRLNDSRINAVAMTVQPNAPIDPATGLPTPTIAIAHEAGIAVIHDVNNGTVYDINTDASVGPSVDFIDFYNGTNIVCGWDTVGSGTRSTYTYNILNQTADHTADDVEIRNGRYVDPSSGGGAFIYYSQDAARVTKVLGLKDNTFVMVPNSYNPALTLIDEDTRADAGGMSAFIHTDFNTGWMPGKTRLAALSDTSTTDLNNGETEYDRSPKNNHLTVTGSISKTAVGTGSDLVYYSGYSSSNHLTKNGIPAPGTGDFSVSVDQTY